MAVTSFEEFLAEKEKKKKKVTTVAPASDNKIEAPTYNDLARVKSYYTGENIAPVKEGTWFQKGAFDDGYQFGDVTKGTLGTVGDVGLGLLTGAGVGLEGLTDLLGYGVAEIADALGNKRMADEIRWLSEQDSIRTAFQPAEDFLSQYSLLGEKADVVSETVGQVLGLKGVDKIVKGIGATGAAANVIVNGYVGASAMGSGMTEALNENASLEDAVKYGASSGAIEIITEMLFGGFGKAANAIGLGKGLTSIDDMLARKLSSKIASKFGKNLVQFLVKSSGEGVEEVLAGLGSAIAKNLTYKSEEELNDLIKDERLLEQFLLGTLASGIMQGGEFIGSTKQGRDFVTGLTANENAVLQHEYEKRVASTEKSGQKLNAKEKRKIYDEVMSDLQKGKISTDTIESVLGGETAKAYNNAVAKENALIKQANALRAEFNKLNKMKTSDMTGEQIDRREELRSKLKEIAPKLQEAKNKTQSKAVKTKLSEEVQKLLTETDAKSGKIVRSDNYLIESYNDRARVEQKFEVDLSKYDEKERAFVKRAVDGGLLANNNAAHEIVDTLAKWEAFSGVQIDFTTTELINKMGYGVEGRIVNGIKTKNGIAVNIKSPKALNFIVGHELTHAIEKAGSYENLAKTLLEYAKSKNDYEWRVKAVKATYKGVKADIDAEIVADLVGEYIFSDKAFVDNLYKSDRNVFQKLFDEIKRLWRLATAGSKEKRQLEKAKNLFEDAIRENAKAMESGKADVADSDIKHSIEMTSQMPYKDQLNQIEKKQLNGSHSFYIGTPSTQLQSAGLSDAPLAMNQSDYRKSRRESGNNKHYSAHAVSIAFFQNLPKYLSDASMIIDNGSKMTVVTSYKMQDTNGNDSYVIAGVLRDQTMNNDTVNQIKSVYPLDDFVTQITTAANDGKLVVLNEKKAEQMLAAIGIQPSEASNILDLAKTIIPQNSQKSSSSAKFTSGNSKEISETDKNDLKQLGLEYDADSETVSLSLSSLEDAFNYHTDENGVLLNENEYTKARDEYVNALARSIAADKSNPTAEEIMKASKYLDGLFLVHDLIASDKARLDYEAAVDKSAWVSNSEYGGSIDFSTLCAKRRLFTGTFDAIQNALPDTVLNENDFLKIRDMLLEKELESPCSMCYVEGSRAKHGVYVDKWLKEYLKTNPKWKPQIADFASSTRLERTRIEHPEAYDEYQKAMNKLAQRKPKEASVRTDYKGEILVAFADGSSVEIKNKNGGIRFNSFSDFEIIHALDCMQVITDMARVGLNGQAYTKVKEFAEAFGNTGLKINLSLVAKDVDANGNLIYDEVNGMNHAEAMNLRSKYSDNVGTVVVVFNDAQLKAAIADPTIDYVLPFHRSQWKKSQYTMMGLPVVTKDYTALQNDRIKNPNTGKPVKLTKLKKTTTYTNDVTGETYTIKDNIMPNMYWDYSKSGRENADRYLSYINSNGMTPKFDFLLEKVDGKWVLPDGAVGDGYFKLLIDFKMYSNEGWGSPQNPVLPEFNMPYIQQMLENYKGGHQSFPVAHDVVDAFVKGKKNGEYSLSMPNEPRRNTSGWQVYGEDVRYQPTADDIAPVKAPAVQEDIGPVAAPAAPSVNAGVDNKEDIAPVKAPSNPNALSPLKAPANNSNKTIEELQHEYGTIPQGEHPVRDDSLPKSTTGKDKVSQTARTVKGAKATPDELVDLLDKETAGGRLSYVPITNDETVQKAYNSIAAKGWEAARGEWETRVRRGEVSAELTATGGLLLNNAAKAGDTKAWLDILRNYQLMGSNAGQAIQAMKILKTLTPSDSLYMIERSVEQMVEDMKLDTEIVIDETLKKAYLEAKTDAEKDAALDALAENIASQIPATAMEKWTAIRYLNMLGNFRTQGRNIFGNVGMAVTSRVKNTVAATIEIIAEKASGGEFQRTKSVFVDKNLLKAAKADFATVEHIALNGGKFNDTQVGRNQFQQKIQDARTIFKSKPLEKYRKATNWAMDKGDLVFSRAAYARSLAGYLQANGIKETDFSKIDQKTLDKAREYAVNEAQETTFRDNNWLSSWVSKIGRRPDTPKAGQLLAEGIVPFRKTPANILLRAEEYSPLGIINATVNSIKLAKGNESVTGADVVNSWAKALTGTGLLALGMLLNNAGALAGGADEDEDKDWFESMYGWQNYAIQIGDYNFTIDFLSPSAMPLLMGAQLNELRQDGGIELKDLESALLSIADPMIEMSMLQGVNDTLDNIRYSENNMGQFLINACLSYLTQGITNSLLGQLERSLEGQRMTTFVDKDSALPVWLQKWLGKTSAKGPGWDYNQIPYVDAWGETEDIGPVGGLLENTLSPSYISEGFTDEVYDELNRLNEVQSDINVYPQTPNKTITFEDANGNIHENYNLSAEEYEKLAKLQGQTQKALVEQIISSDVYAELTDAEKAKAIQLAYKYAKEYGRQEVLGSNGFSTKWMSEAGDNIVDAIIAHTSEERTFASEYPGRYAVAKSVGGYDKYRSYSSELSGISGKQNAADYINSLDADYGEKIILWKSKYKSDNTYNNDIIDYLNSRDDLSYEDISNILTELGFTVHPDGRVTW